MPLDPHVELRSARWPRRARKFSSAADGNGAGGWQAVARGVDRITLARRDSIVQESLLERLAGRGGDLSTDLLLEEVARTRPLSVTRRETVEGLRKWAAGSAVPAS